MTEDSLPAAGVYVAAIPNAPHRDEEWKYRWEITDQNGKFMLRGISPGDYQVFSWDAIENLDWYDPQVMKPYEDKAAAVSVKEGEQKRVELTVMDKANAPSKSIKREWRSVDQRW